MATLVCQVRTAGPIPRDHGCTPFRASHCAPRARGPCAPWTATHCARAFLPNPNRPLPAPQELELGVPKPRIAEASRAVVATPQASAADADDARDLIQSPL